MNELEQARQQIDEIDAQMAALFEQRMQAVTMVAHHKAQTGMAVFDASREDAVVAKNVARLQNPKMAAYYEDFIRHTMAVSRSYQEYRLGLDKVAYQGVEGAFTHIALRHLFPHSKALNFAGWNEVFDAVVSGECAYGVLPFENSNAGDVSSMQDLCYQYEGIHVVQMYDQPISQNLLVVPGTALRDVRTVLSHPQAISQSSQFLRANGLTAKASANTAIAAKQVAEMGDKSVAAIASAETAALYGLEVLVRNINTDGDNTTRFIVISKETPASGNRFSLLFTVSNKPGALSEIIQIIGRAGFNMESIKSRPHPGEKFQYYFYVEIEGSPMSEKGKLLLDEMQKLCRTVRLLGVYSREEPNG